jgi:two-component system, NtrC family, response regulator PilR
MSAFDTSPGSQREHATARPENPMTGLVGSRRDSRPSAAVQAAAAGTSTLEAGAHKGRLLVVDDERSMRELLAIVLGREGFEVVVAENGKQALAELERRPVDLLISDIHMPDMTGLEVLRTARTLNPDLAGIMVTAFASTETAIEALRMGAYDYIHKPFNVDELKIVVRGALERRQLKRENVLLKRALQETHQFSNIIGRSETMVAVFELIETIAQTTSTVMVTGESGTGKELAARAIHFNSLRRDRPFVAVNCGALTETLLESELFGHVKGSFTGASSNKKGLIEVADKGTIFLDEIGEMSPLMQVKLLRVLQERTFRRVGGTEETPADIRIIAATNRDLAQMVAEGRFREDLYYRINVIPLHLPPLRERQEDISLLAHHFVERFAREMGKTVQGLANESLEVLRRYHWPGNIRELENAMERAVALERTPLILPSSLPPPMRAANGQAAAAEPPLPTSDDLPDSGFDLERHVRDIERRFITEALKRTDGVKVKAAELLGMSFRSFRYYAKKYGL